VSKNNNSLFQNEIIKWEFTIFTSQSKIDNIIIYMSQQCILGQGKLFVVLVQLTLWNSCITVITIMQKLQYMILKFILDINFRMLRLPRVFCLISLKWDMEIGKILFILS